MEYLIVCTLSRSVVVRTMPGIWRVLTNVGYDTSLEACIFVRKDLLKFHLRKADCSIQKTGHNLLDIVLIRLCNHL